MALACTNSAGVKVAEVPFLPFFFVYLSCFFLNPLAPPAVQVTSTFASLPKRKGGGSRLGSKSGSVMTCPTSSYITSTSYLSHAFGGTTTESLEVTNLQLQEVHNSSALLRVSPAQWVWCVVPPPVSLLEILQEGSTSIWSVIHCHTVFLLSTVQGVQ